MHEPSAPLIVLKQLAGNEPMQLSSLQMFMTANSHVLVAFWISVWCATAVVLAWMLYREWRRSR